MASPVLAAFTSTDFGAHAAATWPLASVAKVMDALVPNTDGAVPGFTPVSMPVAKYVIVRHFVGDYYFRIWVYPEHLVILSPRLGIPYAFTVWNAYPESNTWSSLSGSGQTGLTLSLGAPQVFRGIEEKVLTVTIGAAAPSSILATFTFNFTQGAGTFTFEARLATILNLLAEAGVTENWEWLTDIIRADDGTEQRIALRDVPRRTIGQQIVLEGDTDRRRLYAQLSQALGSDVIIPHLPYMSFLTQAAGIGANRLYFDPKYTDVREGELAAVIDPVTEEVELVTIATVEVDGATLVGTLGVNAAIGWGVVPAFTSRLANLTGPQMLSIVGNFQARSVVIGAREDFIRPGSLSSILAFDGYIILDRRPLANASVDEAFDGGFDVIDSQTGISTKITRWSHAFVSGRRQFLISRYTNPGELDFWRDFLYYARGMQEPFLMPTFRHDLTVHTQPASGGTTFIINEPDYVSGFFPHPTYKRLEFMTSAGSVLRRVVSVAVNNGDGTATLTVTEAFPGPLAQRTITRVSFLNLTRLNSDIVTLDHGHRDTILELAVRTIDA